MIEKTVHDIGLIFLLGFQDEKLAMSAASHAIATLKSRGIPLDGELFDRSLSVETIKICRRAWQTHFVNSNASESWVLPSRLKEFKNVSAWGKFQKATAPDELMTLLFSAVAGVADEDLAAGLEISVGTIRYRIGRAVRMLGLFLPNDSEMVEVPTEARGPAVEPEGPTLKSFIAKELLFDYATGQLDAHRRSAIQDYLKSDAEGVTLLSAVRRGLAFQTLLSSIQLVPEALAELSESENIRSLLKRVMSWSSWPDALRWSLIAVVISIITAGTVVTVPWSQIPIFQKIGSSSSGDFQLARVDTVDDESEQEADPAKNGTRPSDRVAEADKDKGQQAEAQPSEEQEASLEGSGDEEFANLAPDSKVPATASTPTSQSTPATVVANSAETSQEVASRPKAPVSRGFVYRAFMTLSDLENVAPKITQQIKELGAEKAGEVELGWKRGTGRYYHFTVPESNEEKLMETLRGYGPVRISKDPHPRVMPKGQLRFILWIESGS